MIQMKNGTSTNKQEKLKARLYKFALNSLKFVRVMPKETVGKELGGQLLRSATAVAASFEEAAGGTSKDEIIGKLSTALKEAKESHLRLRLIRDSELRVDLMQVGKLALEAGEISKILAKSLKSSREKLK